MASDNWEPVRSLEAIEADSPTSARRDVVRVFQTAADADFAVFCHYRVGPEGHYFTSIESVGDVAEAEGDRALEPLRPVSPPDWDPSDPPDDVVDRFRARRLLPDGSIGDFATGPCMEAVRSVGDVRHQAQVLLYDDTSLLGWLAVYRTEDRSFEDGILDQLDELIGPAKRVLIQAERQEREMLTGESVGLLVDPETFEVEGTTASGKRWLDQVSERVFRGALEEADELQRSSIRLNVEGFLVRLEEISGDIGRRYFVTVECPRKPRMTIGTLLTPRQEEVVGYAAAGATNREIAETLGISTDTVSDHLSESYRRLGVANRVELARKMAESETFE